MAGRRRKVEHNLKYSISVHPDIAFYVDRLCEISQLKRSQVIAMSIKHFYKECMKGTEYEIE